MWFGPKVALSELSCSFGPGVTGLLGPNGAGKTTLMRAMTGLVGVNQGTVRVEGRDPRHGPGGPRPDGAGPGGRGGAGRAHGPAVRPLRRRPPRRRRSRRARRRAADGLDARRRRPAGRHVQQGHAAAHQDRLRARERSAGARARRTVERRRSRCSACTSSRCSSSSAREGRTVIVSSHVLNEVERMAERVIVLMHGRLAAAGGHHAIRDAMDDRPRHVLVRSDDGRRLAASLVALESVGRRDVRHDTRRPRDPDRAGPRAGDRACRGSRATRRSGCSRCARSTTRSRACSGSWSDDRAVARRRPNGRGRGSSRSSSTRCSRASRRSGGRRCCLPCAGRAAVRTARPRRRRHRRAGVRERRRRGHLRSGDADRGARHRRLGARRRGARRHVPLHVAVPDPDVADRARPMVGRLVRRARHDRPGVRARRDRRRHPRQRRHRRSSPPPSAACRTSRCSSPIGCLTRRTAVWSLAFVFLIERLLGAALTGIAQLSPTWESRAIFVGYLDDPPSRLVRDGIPQGGDAVVRLRDRHGRRPGRGELADAPPAPVRRRRLTPASDSRSNRPLFGLRHRIRRSSPGSVTQTGGSVGVDWPLRSSVGGANICS